MRDPRSIWSRPKRSEDSVGWGGAASATDDRADPGQKLARVERLRQIIVGADLESDDPVGLVAARRQHQDRRLRPDANSPADFEPVDVRQHHVEDDRVECSAVDRLQAVTAREAALDRKAGRSQIVEHHGRESRVVVDDK